ncbi:MAG TPA: methionine--tRNA ligase [Bryobacteraceae bacterium]|nr:methionine--tRNA ligase [Bryobacteraceae bacterium]HOL72752.1 methionine--tRNA ligase [Bryobacteraceae bacterium]HOQ45768.1 methionine--tRNA ligase [Bryobacteraceae bacterium]HPQ14104.1 methionine--tRNA ligase [Bryobacteraceae bacterium]HPU71505.1 methionine--tRNA ligase [Bryobacteraceae bacterium]
MKYYLTTPIYYVNAAPHIGHAYTTIVADMVRRFKAMQGFTAVLTTGSDEHGVNVERAAKRVGKSPKEFCDVIAAEFERQWQLLGLKIDRFQRTTNPQHARVVQDLFDRCRKNGYIYKGAYTGQYCIHDNLYVTEAKPGDPCPDCGRPTETITEENFFFKLSAFQDRLLELYDKHPEFIQPETRRNEVIAFVKQGLTDLSITRTNINWGIPVKGEAPHVFYVWFDALSTYMSAVEGEGLWPADLHLIGKEIVRFHAIYWPAFLMAADLPLPKRIFAHGWLLFEESKMSKSRGNIVRPEPIRQTIGADALRYFLMREVVFGQDGSFSYDALVGRYNSDLANGLGNLASRTLTMINQYCGGAIPPCSMDGTIPQLAGQTIENSIAAFEAFEFSKGLETIWGLLSATDKFIVEQAPWALAKKPEARAQLEAALYTAAEVLRIATVLLAPVLPESTAKIWAQLGMTEPLESVRLQELKWGQLQPGQKVGEVAPVFPRIEAKSAIEKMRALEEKEAARQAALLGKTPEAQPAAQGEKISIDDFAKIDMRVGLVLEAEPVKGANKLLKLKVDIGEPQPRTLVAGIAEAYTPEQLIGRKVVIVANLQPRKLRGIESNGMIVAASLEGGKPVLAGFLEDVPVGARLK